MTESRPTMRARFDELFLTAGDRIGPLDGIRTLAITLVVARHVFDRTLVGVDLPRPLSLAMGFGWCGVQLFFVLSGFLIGGQLYDTIRKGGFSFARFYLSRSLRILPAAYFFMVVYAHRVLAWDRATLVNVLYIGNIVKGPLIAQHLWSLCVEEQFYLVFPAFFFLTLRRATPPRAVVNILCGTILAGWTARTIFLLLSGTGAAIAYHDRQLWFHFDYFLLGTLSAVLCKERLLPRLRGPWLALVLLPGYAILAWAMSPLNEKSQALIAGNMGWGFFWMGLWCFAVVTLASLEDSALTRFLANPVFRWIAALSYSIYLFHLMVLERTLPYVRILFILRLADHPVLIALAAFAATWAGAAAVAFYCFLFVERPFMRLRHRLFAVQDARRPAATLSKLSAA